MQLTIKTFPKYKPNITLDKVLTVMHNHCLQEAITDCGNKEIRLAIELIKQKRKINPALIELDFYDEVRRVLDSDISNERINAVKPFKKIIYQKKIEIINGKPKIVKKLRKRNISK